MLERYITAADLAELMGVSVKTVRRFTAAGMPSETWGMARTRRYRASECLAWARRRADTVVTTPRRFTAADRKD